ncbi:MAG: RNA methyltransferase [Myxococcales bacterium]|nr:RNA methyltransferase [Myxococcales bacterium]
MTPWLSVDDPHDPRLDLFRDISARRDPARRAPFYVESELAVARLLASDFTTLAVLGTPAHLGRILADAPARCPVYACDHALLRGVVGFDLHRGVIACARRPPALTGDLPESTCPIHPVAVDLAAILARPTWTVLLVQGLADPANLGSIVRSARAFAVDLVVLDHRGADPLDRRAIRGAMGHVFAQPLAVAADLPAAVLHLQARGAAVYAATLGPRARPVAGVGRPARLVICVGNEGEGLPAAVCAAADLEVTIPIARDVDSLGVAAAAAVLLHALAAAPLAAN